MNPIYIVNNGFNLFWNQTLIYIMTVAQTYLLHTINSYTTICTFLWKKTFPHIWSKAGDEGLAVLKIEMIYAH